MTDRMQCRFFVLRYAPDAVKNEFNAIQPSEFQACLAASAVSEADELARLYLERPKRRQQAREPGARVAIVARMRSEFEAAGVWPVMLKNIALSKYTRSGDPLKIDCGYSPNGTVKLFHAVTLSSDVNAAKVLAFSFPQLAEGIRKTEGKQALLTAIVEDDLPVDDETVNFARETLEQNTIRIANRIKNPGLLAGADLATLCCSKGLEAFSFKDSRSHTVDYRRDRLMGDTLHQVDGNCCFCGIIHAKRNAHALNSGLTHQAADVRFFNSYCSINFLLSSRRNDRTGRFVKYQTSANTVNRRRHPWYGAA
jgi:hypothetical protein